MASEPKEEAEAEPAIEVAASTEESPPEQVPVDVVPQQPTNWSELLNSPTDVAIFSPSLDFDSSRHGTGLQLATERSKSVGRFSKRSASYLTEIANAYERFGAILYKLSYSIHPESQDLPSSVTKDAQAFHESMKTFATNTGRLGKYYKMTIVQPLMTTIAANRNVLDTHGQRYVASRSQCRQARRRALSARKKCDKSTKATDRSFRRWRMARRKAEKMPVVEGSPEDTALVAETESQWEPVLIEYGKRVPNETNTLIQQLIDLESSRVRYSELVDNEHHAVDYAQQMEGTTLDQIQQIEYDRIKFFVKSTLASLSSTDEKLLEKFVQIPGTTGDFEGAPTDSKRGSSLLGTIFARQTYEHEPGKGLTDSESLNLPRDIGQLREEVKSLVMEAESHIKLAQVFAVLLQDLQAALADLTLSLLVDSAQESKESLCHVATTSIGPRSADVWKGIVQMYEGEGDRTSTLGVTVQKCLEESFSPFLETAHKELAHENETDDSNWKTLCDTCRQEAKIAARYRQTKANEEKARERMQLQNREDSQEGDSEPAQPVQKNRMSKTFFAGGEVVKKFQDARMAMARSNLNEAEQSAAKEQQALDTATALKEQATGDYEKVTGARVVKLKELVERRRVVIVDTTQLIKTTFEEVLQLRAKPLKISTDGNKNTVELVQLDIADWSKSAKEKVDQAANDTQEGDSAEIAHSGFKLEKTTVSSTIIDDLLGLEKVLDPVPEFIVGDGDTQSVDTTDDDMDKSRDGSVDSTISSTSFVDTASLDADKSFEEPPVNTPPAPHSKSDSVLPSRLSSFRQAASPRRTQSAPLGPTLTDFETLKKHFPDETKNDAEVLKTFRCVYRPKEKSGFLVPNQPGKLYTTREHLYFLASDGKGFVLRWHQINDLKKEKGFMGGILVRYSLDATDLAFSIGRLDSLDTVWEHLSDLRGEKSPEKEPEQSPSSDSGMVTESPVPPDATLKKMTIVLSKKVRGVSIKNVYEKVWSEAKSEKPFYLPWLETEECFDISVPDWEVAAPGSGGFQNPWCKEKYTQRRKVVFKFKRSTLLYMGKPIATVEQVHHCRVEGDDLCIVAISASFDGLPYSDTFCVEMRWVARRLGSTDIQIDVGLEVNFKKATMLKSQIRTGTINETRNLHGRLFEAVRVACQGDEGSIHEADKDLPSSEDIGPESLDSDFEPAGPLSSVWRMLRNSINFIPMDPNFIFFAGAVIAYPMLWGFFSSVFGAPGISMNEARRLNVRIDNLTDEVQKLREALELTVDLLKEQQAN